MDDEKFFKFSQNVFQYLGLWTRNCEKNHTFKARCIRYAVIYFSGGIIPVLSVFDTIAAARTASVFAALTKALFGFAYLMCVHKLVAVGANGTKIYSCIRRLEVIAQRFEDRTDFKACLRGYEKTATIDSVATNSCVITFMAAALVTKEFPYNCDLPHFDFSKSPNYEIMFVYQSMAVATVANAMIAYDMVFCGLMYVCCGLVSSIRREIRQIDISRDNGKLSENAFREIIKKLIETSSIIRQISDTFSLTTVTSIFYNSSVMAFGLLMISFLPPSDLTWSTMICAVIAVTFQIWMYCYFGQLVVNEKERLEMELYCTNWYNGSKNFRTMMLLTIFEVQQERYIKAGNILPLSLETLTAVLKKAYAFYAFFKRVAV